MASVREKDRNEDVFIGVRFPLDHSQEGFFYKTKTILDQAKSNMRNLLLTSLGERVMQPEFGSTLMDVVFNQGPDVENDIDEAIREAVSNWLPYVIINEINMFQQGNQVDVSIDFSVSLEPDSFDTITFNFNIGE
jgi:phage baseplate assembly protein W|tara:strand:- start:288 stop:692 length:405 start_codon:yes stop_codon:yes gene_type:complete